MFYRSLAIAVPFLMTACASSPDTSHLREHVAPLKGSPIMDVETDYSNSLSCLAQHAERQSFPAPRVAVGHITDLTGADDALTGRRLTQGATLMAISAVTKAGMRVVERYDMGVIQVELDYAQNGLLRDAPGVLRKTKAGQVEGADLYIVGGITEYNPNIRSSGKYGYVGGNDDPGGAISIGKNEYVIDIGLDLRIIDARSTEVMGVRAFRKQIRGNEVEAGVFSFFGGTVIDIGGGQRALEPVQTAVRSMVERAVYEFLSDVYGLSNGACQSAGTPQNWQTSNSYQPQPAPRAVAPQTRSNYMPAPRANYAAPMPTQQVQQPRQPSYSQGQYFVEVDGFGTYSSAISTLAFIKYHIPELESQANRVVETQTPYGKSVYGLNIMEGSGQSSARDMCQRLQAIGYVCQVRAGGATASRSAQLRPSTSQHW